MSDITPFLILGIALGGIYSLPAVGTIVLYRATGVLNFASGAIGAVCALVAFTVTKEWGGADWMGFLAGIVVGTGITVAYGLIYGKAYSRRDALTKALGTLGFTLILLGLMSTIWGDDARFLPLPTNAFTIALGVAVINGTQILSVGLAATVTIGTAIVLQRTKIGTAMRGLADDRDIIAMLGVPVRRVEMVVWLGFGVLASVSGLLLANLAGLSAVGLTFLVIPSMAAAVIGRLSSLGVTFGAAIVIGVVQSSLSAFPDIAPYRTAVPFLLAILATLWFARRRVPMTRV
jgi:branched-chain amino acid transport system permease protein